MLRRAFTCAILILLLGAATSGDEQDPAIVAYKNCVAGKATPQELIADCSTALLSRRLNVEGLTGALFARSLALAKLGQADAALQDLSSAIKLKPDLWPAYFMRFQIYNGEKREHEKAVAEMTTVVNANPKMAVAFNKRGVAEDYLGQKDAAIADFTRAIQLQPTTQNYTDRGETLMSSERYNDALADFNEALRLQPDFATALSDRGKLHFDRGEFAAAAADLAKAVDLKPRYAYPVMWLYLAQMRAGQDGIPDLERNMRALDLDSWPGPLLLLFLGKIAPKDITPEHNPVGWIELGNLCEAKFYLAEYYIVHGAPEKAPALLQAAIDTGVIEYVEYYHAKAELKRRGQP